MEQERRTFIRRSADERIAVLEDRYGNLNERVASLETVLQDIKTSVDKMSNEIASARHEFTDEVKLLRREVADSNEKLREELKPLTELQKEARGTYRLVRKIAFYVLLPFGGIYLLVSGVPASENAVLLIVKLIKLLSVGG